MALNIGLWLITVKYLFIVALWYMYAFNLVGVYMNVFDVICSIFLDSGGG